MYHSNRDKIVLTMAEVHGEWGIWWVVGDRLVKRFNPSRVSRLRGEATKYRRTFIDSFTWGACMTLVNAIYVLDYPVVQFMRNWERGYTLDAAA